MNEQIMIAAGFNKQVENARKGLCALCKVPVRVADFRDWISRKEYGISKLCQKCQDSVFGTNDN